MRMILDCIKRVYFCSESKKLLRRPFGKSSIFFKYHQWLDEMRYARKTNASLLAFLCYRWCCISWSMQLLDERESNNEEYFREQTKILQSYEIITPAIYNAGDLDGVADSSTVLQIGAFGKTYEIVVQNKKNENSFNTYVEYIGKNNSYEAKYMREDGCFYSGIINTSHSEPLEVVLNYCNGIEGMIYSNNSVIFIEPIRNNNLVKKTIYQKHLVYRGEDVRLETTGDVFREKVVNTPSNMTRSRQRRGTKISPYQSYLTFINKSGRTVQLYYLDAFKSHIPFITFVVHEKRSVNTYLGTTWIAKDDKTDQLLLLNKKTKFVATKNSASRRITVTMSTPDDFKEISNTLGNGQLTNSVGGDHHYIEVLVVADDSVIKFHGKDRIEKYILTMMDIASRVFKHRSLGTVIHFQVVRIVLIEDNQAGFTVYKKNPTKTLKSACNFISSLQNPDESDRDHFDFGIALSRKDFGPSGFAQLYSMCSSSRSCALVQDEGLTSAFIVAHETGHLLGLEHDGEGEASRCTNEGPRGSIMAPVIVARYDRYRWSTCSKEVLKENVEYFQCLRNTPRQRFRPSHRNRGALYSLTEQCQFNFDKDYTTCTSFSYNPCRRLWCSKSNSNSYCKTMRGPALEGTICERNKHCLKGECVEHGNRIYSDDVKEERKTIHGNWGRWSTWSSCSRTCRVGIRSRTRRCDNPERSSDGNPCSGKNIQREVCNTKRCKALSFYSRQVKHCQDANGGDWTVYTDKDFAVKLGQMISNPNCTFESDFCNWKNDKGNKINWKVNSGATQSFNTGPSTDKTLRTSEGKYIYVEASGTRHHPKQQGDNARLISKPIDVPRICFTMYYHMFGRDMGEVYIKVKHKNNSEVILWKASGNKGDVWHKAQVNIESVTSYSIIIEAVRGQHWASDIAVDDLSVVAGFCSPPKKSKYQCKVSCRTKDARNFKMNTDVTDGERCGGIRSSNICLHGKCITFGCDNKFGSKLQIDQCGICGGNGSKCVRISHKKEIRPMKDYEMLLTLEKGSTFVDIHLKYSEVKYYYGLRTVHDNSLKMIMKAEAHAVVANSAFHFTKVNGKQHIVVEGPLSARVDLIIYTYEQHRSNKQVYVNYEYFKPTVTKFSYNNKRVGWEPCSRTCGTGQQKSAVSCIRVEDKVTVDKSFCKGLDVALYIRACRLDPCPQKYKWVLGNWVTCTKTCDGGLSVRNVDCKHVTSNAVVEDRLCPSIPPKNKKPCNTNSCPKWHTSNWESCSKTCGSGIQMRAVKCIDQGTGNAVDDAKCVSNDKPDVLSPCNIQPCEKYIYIIQKIGKRCSKSCGGGKRIQIVNCVKNSTREPVMNFYCDGPSPPRLADCNQKACPEFVWKVKSSACSQTCGNGGTITREILCVNLENDQRGKESNCPAKKPSAVVSCSKGKCPVFKWKVHESSPCSKTCGNGSIIREIICRNVETKRRVNPGDCVEKRLPEIVPCFVRKCIIYHVVYSSWGKCSVTCGTGVKRRTFTCLESISRRRVSHTLCVKKQLKLERRCTSTVACKQVDKLYCDFDRRNFCNWKNMKNSDFKWSIGKKTPSVYTGPEHDHTTKQGYFAYMEGSLPRKKGEKARLTSPFIRIPRGCFSFWYHMRGEGDMGRLRVLLSSSKSDQLIFERRGHQGSYWIQAKIDINKIGPYRLIFEATRGTGVYSDAAIDDISFQNNVCKRLNKKHIRQSKIPPNCREISPYCKHRNREQYCKGSPAYRILCCRTCPSLINTKPNVTVIEHTKKN